MIRSTGKRSLEGYKVFPFVAWTLTVVFALFVYNIVTELQAVTSQLQDQTTALEHQVSNINNPDSSFDAYQESRTNTSKSQ